MKNVDSKIWAYLHNELSAEERQQFEQALTDCPELQQALEERKATHAELNEILPLLHAEDEQLEQELLAEWEAEHPEYQKPPKRKRTIKFPLLALAAAAAALMLVMHPWAQGPIDWQRTALGSAPQLRGATGSQGYYSAAELKQAARDLQVAAETRLLELSEKPAKWTLKISMQELANGLVAIEVSGHPQRQPNRAEIWGRTFDSLESLREHTNTFAGQIAEDIVSRNH